MGSDPHPGYFSAPLQTADPEVFKTMEVAIRDFMNSTKWSFDDYVSDERIECAFQINILEEVSQKEHPKGSIEQMVGDFYASGMDTISSN